MPEGSPSPSRIATLATALLGLALTTAMAPAGLATITASPTASPTSLGWEAAPTPAGAPSQDIGGNADVLVANTWEDGTYRSTDGGETWASVDAHGVSSGQVVFDPSDPDRGYVAGFDGLARTTDGGQTWELLHDTERATVIDVHPDGTGAASVREGSGHATQTFLLSEDGGDTWTQLAKPYEGGQALYGLAFGPASEDIVVASLSSTWVSHDGGETWTEEDQGARWLASDDEGTLWRAGMGETHPSEDGTFEEHPERSTDGGDTWEPIAYSHIPTNLAPHPEGGLYVASSAGVHATTDAGETWSDMGAGDVARATTGMMADPADPDAVFFTDEEIGINWVGPHEDGYAYEGRTQGLAPAEVWTTGSSPSGDVLLAGGPQGLYASADGQAWKHAGAGLGVPSMRAVAATDGGERLYAGGQTWIYQPYVQVGSLEDPAWKGHLLSQNDGSVVDIEVHPEQPDTAWALAQIEIGPDRVVETRDGGESWEPILSGGVDGPSPVPDAVADLRDLAYDDSRDALVVATQAGLLVQDETGTWAPHATGPTGAQAVAATDGTLLAASEGTGLWKAHTGTPLLTPWATTGETTTEIEIGPQGQPAWTLSEQGTVHACTPAEDAPLGTCAQTSPPADAVSITYAATDGSLWAATLEDGFYRASAR